MKNPDAILMSDPHVRHDTPACRLDNYMEAQESKWRQIFAVSEKYDIIPILCAGDLGHRAYWPNPLLTWFMGLLIGQPWEDIVPPLATVLGQHDLPYHQPGKYGEGGVRILEQAGLITVLKEDDTSQLIPGTFISGAWWGQSPAQSEVDSAVLVMHKMVIDSPLWPGQEAPQARTILRKHPGFKLILTGDNHKPFVEEFDGRLLVNPGSLMRMTADQIDHRPRVYLWREKDNELEEVFLDVVAGVVSRDHIQEVTETSDARMEAFVERFGASRDVGLSFQDNLQAFFDANSVPQAVQDKVWKAVG